MQMNKKLERSISERVSPQNGLYAGGQKMRSDPAMCFLSPSILTLSVMHMLVGTCLYKAPWIEVFYLEIEFKSVKVPAHCDSGLC